MPEITCQFTGCTVKCENESEPVMLAMFQSHLLTHQQPTGSGNPTKQRIPPIPRPEIKQDISDEDWDTFVQEWNHFKRCTNIPTANIADHLFQCCEKGLGRLLIRENPAIFTKGEEKLFEAMKKIAVIKVATGVRRTNLLNSKQDHAESFREFYANVKAAASTCKFSVKCPNDCCKELPDIDYTPLVVKDVLISGIADNDIRKEVLGWSELDKASDKQVITIVEEKEIAHKAWIGTPAGASGISSFRKMTKTEDSADATIQKKLGMKGNCSKCKSQISIYKKYRSGGMNRSPFKFCPECFNKQHAKQDDYKGNSESSAITSFIGAIETNSSSVGSTTRPDSATCRQPVKLDHHIFTANGWRKALTLNHPTLRLRVSTQNTDYSEFRIPLPKISPRHVDVIVDSGAQSCLWSRKEFVKCGFNTKDLIPVHHSMKAANSAPITIDGAIFLRLSGQSRDGKAFEAAVMTYISPDADNFFLSREAMVQL